MNEPLIFDIALGRTKPFSMTNSAIRCPFCDVENLTNILDKKGHMIWLMNKYPVLKNTWPTLIIETDDDQGEFSLYSHQEATKILSYCIKKWQETMSSKEFKSVLHFKNHGPMSGGSIRHPHSQIIGLRDYDYREDVMSQHFEGWLMYEDQDVTITLSQKPLIGFFEYNIRFKPLASRSQVTLRLQQTLQYLLNTMAKRSQSYNYFFYNIEDGYYYIKVVPRYVTTPLYVGYKIVQTCDDARAELIKQEINTYLK